MRRTLAAFALLAALVLAAVPAMAAGPGGGGHTPGETEEGTNNLSVPAVFVPDTGAFGVTCDGLPDPAGASGTAPLALTTAYPGYYFQGYDTWQGACTTAATALVTAVWGDNLTGAPLKANRPIRVEVGLLAQNVGAMPGFQVEKLDPNMLDREAPYGTLGVEQLLGEVRVWDNAATFSIDGPVPVSEQPMSAEINSTGRVVYGYNWRTPAGGEYTITFTAPTVDVGTAGNHVATITVQVGSGGGGGGPRD